VGVEAGFKLFRTGLGVIELGKEAGHKGKVAGAWAEFPNSCNVIIF
jgi:hypothetical protein